MPDPLPILTDRLLAGRYRVVRAIARGGMAEVWEGYDEVLARPVAIKILHQHLAVDEAFVERFRREAIAAARLAHPNIVATFDTGTDGDVAFIVMELVRGRNLRQAMEEAAGGGAPRPDEDATRQLDVAATGAPRGALPVAVAVTIAAEVASALDHAHRAGLVHRDIKPANILLLDNDGGTAPVLRVKVADFGIAKLQATAGSLGGDLTQTGAVVGTAKYLSPEQIQGRPPDARSDEYALGVVLYEMLCGRPPFKGENDLATALQHVRTPPPLPRGFRPGLPPSLEAIVLRAMAKDPDERYPSTAELRTALLAVELGDGGHDASGSGGGHSGEDDAVPAVVRDPTPPSGIAPGPRLPGRRVLPAVVLLVLAGVVLTTAALLLERGERLPQSTAPGARDPGAPTVAAVTSYDPQGDGQENERRVRLVADGDAATSWVTDRYNTRPFGGLKQGVGLVLRLARPADVRRIEVMSPSSGWAAAVHVAERPQGRLEAWGAPVASRSGIRGNVTFDLRGQRAGAVLLWITDPGPDRRVEISEVVLR